MSNSAKIATYQVDKAVSDILNAYSDEAIDIIKTETKKAADECVKMLRDKSPHSPSNEYAKGWKIQQKTEGRTSAEYIIGNDNYRLPHLLEYGHKKVLWGKKPKNTGDFVEGKAHIRPSEEAAVKQLEESLERSLKK